MKNLEEYSLKYVTDYIIAEIAQEKGVSKSLAKKLFVNAISYNIVVNEIKNQVDYLMEA